MSYKVLQPYKDWLMLTRGKIEPRVGDRYIKFEVSNEQTIEKSNNITNIVQSSNLLKQEWIIKNTGELNIHLRSIGRNPDSYFENKYVEVHYPVVETTKIIQIEDDYFGDSVILDATECCKVNPITNENYCPNCGKKIIR